MITLSTLSVLESDPSMILKGSEKLQKCFKNDTDIEAHHSLCVSTSLT